MNKIHTDLSRDDNPEIGVKLSDQFTLTSDIETKEETGYDVIYISLKAKDTTEKKDLVCVKTTDIPNLLKICVFSDPESEEPEQEIFIDLDEIRANM